MRGAVTSHDGNVLLREIDLHALRTELLEEEFLGKNKLKGSPVVVSVAIAKVEGRKRSWTGAEGCPWDWPLCAAPSTRQTSRPGVRLHKLRFEELWLSSTARSESSRDSCCVDSRTSVTRQASRQRKEPLGLDGDGRERLRRGAAAHCAWLSTTAFQTKAGPCRSCKRIVMPCRAHSVATL